MTSSVVPVFAEETTAQTEVSVVLSRQVSAGNLLGIEDNYENLSSILITTPETYQDLPQTNEKIEQLYPFLGFVFVGCSWIMWHFRTRKEAN